MVGDAEGATKVVEVRVTGAASDDDALRAARQVAQSALCKCSWYGQDPYWGRIVSELGSSGAAFDPDKGRYNTFDTMKVWSGYRDFVKLKDLARELLGDTCEDIDGSEVAGLWATNPEKVVEHCRQDVERVRALYRKFKAVL
jgi:glutamate N-acetyltransferase/amino-acid N-acetyltransferase